MILSYLLTIVPFQNIYPYNTHDNMIFLWQGVSWWYSLADGRLMADCGQASPTFNVPYWRPPRSGVFLQRTVRNGWKRLETPAFESAWCGRVWQPDGSQVRGVRILGTSHRHFNSL